MDSKREGHDPSGGVGSGACVRLRPRTRTHARTCNGREGAVTMSMMPWSPFRELADMQRFGRLWDDAWRERAHRDGFPVDVYETADDVIVRADLPGVRPDDIRVQWTAGHLVISARRDEARPEAATPVRMETFAGEFNRSFDLGIRVDAEGLHADYEDGVLTITAPKAADVRPRDIPIGRGTRPTPASPVTAQGHAAAATRAPAAAYETTRANRTRRGNGLA